MLRKIGEGFVQGAISTASSEAVENILKLTKIADENKAQYAKILFTWLIGCLTFDPPLFIASVLISTTVAKLTKILGCSEETAGLLEKTTSFFVLNRGQVNMSNLLYGLGFLGGVPVGKKLEELARSEIVQRFNNLESLAIAPAKDDDTSKTPT